MTKKLLWTQSGIASVTGGSVIRKFDVTGIAIDSRNIQQGDLFVAIKSRRDGHYFIKNAAQNGASAAVVSWKPKNIPPGFPIIFVKNTDEALKKLALAARSRMRGKIIAITGTAGKTTTKDIFNHILSKKYITHASKSSLNNHLGVPLSLSRMASDTQYGVFEIGMNHAGEITPLVGMVRPDVVIITTVGAGHLEFFDSEADIAKAKAEIFSGVKQGGTAIINRDIIHFDYLHGVAQTLGLKIVTFGQNENADVRVVESNNINHKNVIELSVFGKKIMIETALMGVHNALNIASVFGALSQFDIDLTESAAALSDIIPTDGRGDMMTLNTADKTGEFTIINESYNANPVSMHAALNNIKDLTTADGGLKIAVLGEMKELGQQSDALHIALKDDILACKFDRIYLVGGTPLEALYDALGDDSPSIFSATLEDIIDEIVSETTPHSVVFIKGSHSVGLENLIALYQKKSRHIADDIQIDIQNSDMDNPTSVMQEHKILPVTEIGDKIIE